MGSRGGQDNRKWNSNGKDTAPENNRSGISGREKDTNESNNDVTPRQFYCSPKAKFIQLGRACPDSERANQNGTGRDLGGGARNAICIN